MRLNIVKDEVKSGRLFTEISDHDNGAADSLLQGAISVGLGESHPFTEGLSIVSHDEGNTALSAEGLHKAGVLVIVASLGQDAQLGGASVQSLHAPVN